MPANRQSNPGFFDFMNQPSQRTVAAQKSLPLDKNGNTIPVANSSDSSNVQIKTVDTKPNTNKPSAPKGDPTVVTSGEQNVLNSYRSYTYNFTLAALDKTSVNDPNSYRNSTLNYVIVQSGGKGTAGMSGPSAQAVQTAANNYQAQSTSQSATTESIANAKKTVDQLGLAKDAIPSFNQNSPGRFDMFIENVEVESIIGFSEQSSVSQPTSLKFDIIEPYSINGFMEALHLASLAAGYPSYSQTSFVLKMEFVGYPDSVQLPDPVRLGNEATRYFVFQFTGVEVEVTERGTKYRCVGVPFNEKGFGQPNELKKTTPMTGDTVSDILTNLMKNVNTQLSDAAKLSKEPSPDANKHDVYDIKFPVKVGNTWDYGQTNDIGKSAISELLRDSRLYSFADPGSAVKGDAYDPAPPKSAGGGRGFVNPTPAQQASDPESFKYNPKSPQVQFNTGAQIHEIIASMVRDSEYVKTILKNIKSGTSSIDDYGYIDYFLIKMEVTNQDIYDTQTKKPYQNFTYVVTPYKIHYTRIPGYGSLKIDESKLKTLSKRTYNYIYTGQNIDVLNFKLNFDNLYYESLPLALGNNEKDPSQSGAAPGNSITPLAPKSTAEPSDPGSNGQATQRTDAAANKVNDNNAGPTQFDPYYVLAKNMHRAIVNSKASMITGELEIIGDPFFIVTGGIGNYVPKTATRGVTVDGEADHTGEEVLITINFNNPIDYNSFQNGGLMYFEKEKVPFSGVYRVIKITSTFHEGFFKQKLEIVRIPGQVPGNAPVSDPRDRFGSAPNKHDVVLKDSTAGVISGGTTVSSADAPPAAPVDTAPPPLTDKAYLASIVAKEGPAGLTRAFGVKNLSDIPSDVLSKNDIRQLVFGTSASLTNPLASVSTQFNLADITSAGAKALQTLAALKSGASVETIAATVNNVIGPAVNVSQNLSGSVTSQYGSAANAASPLTNLVG
jgi:hypothetical protein